MTIGILHFKEIHDLANMQYNTWTINISELSRDEFCVYYV